MTQRRDERLKPGKLVYHEYDGICQMTENDIADRIMDAAFQTHHELGPGLLESV
jgi:hypothetical protein